MPESNAPTPPGDPGTDAPRPGTDAPRPGTDAEQVRQQDHADTLERAARAGALHARDRVPSVLLRAQAWLHGWFSNDSRVLMGIVIVAVSVVAAIAISSLRFVQVIVDELDLIAVFMLFLVNWLGNGGILVPIPGARLVGLLMVFQQAVILPSWEVFLVAGAAMGLGQASYYIAGARTAESYAAGDDTAAQQLAADTGMLGQESADFSPGAELDADLVSAMAGTSEASRPSDGNGSRSARLRRRLTGSLERAQERAQPVIERRGAYGMFLLSVAPTPMGTAAAYIGGLVQFGFRRYLVSSFAAKFLLAGVIIMLALVFSDAAHAVALPQIELPQIELPEFDFHIFELPGFGPDATPSPSADPGATPGG